MKTLIVVPARYGSTRFPGKPLADIAGHSMLERVTARARAAANALGKASFVVATDDERITDHCDALNLPFVMTDPEIASGSDRALAAAMAFANDVDFVGNLQGDAPFTPVDYLTRVVEALREDESADVATPCVRLDWEHLDSLREAKKISPFSGTTCAITSDGYALWFSKNILPAIRKEKELRETSALSPVYRHVGLYGFRTSALRRYTTLPASHYEEIEGLEQLRLLENGMRIKCVKVGASPVSTSGIDTREDLERVHQLIKEHGDPDREYFK